MAGQTRLGDDQFHGTGAKMIADIEFFFEQSLGREIFTEAAPEEFDFGQLSAPEFIVLGGIGVDRLARAAMDGEIGLLIACKVERIQSEASCDRSLDNGGRNHSAFVGNLARQSEVYGYDLHDDVQQFRCLLAAESCESAPAYWRGGVME